MSNFAVTIVLGGGLTPLYSETSAGTVVTKYSSSMQKIIENMDKKGPRLG